MLSLLLLTDSSPSHRLDRQTGCGSAVIRGGWPSTGFGSDRRQRSSRLRIGAGKGIPTGWTVAGFFCSGRYVAIPFGVHVDDWLGDSVLYVCRLVGRFPFGAVQHGGECSAHTGNGNKVPRRILVDTVHEI